MVKNLLILLLNLVLFYREGYNAGFIKEDKTVSLKAVGARKLQVSFSEAVDSSKITMQVKEEP